MSEYDAGSVGPFCPACASDDVRREECPKLACDSLDGFDDEPETCPECLGEGGWYVCNDCGESGKPSSAGARP